MTEVNVYEKLNNFMTGERAQLILNSVRGKKAAESLVNRIGLSGTLDLTSEYGVHAS